EVVKIGAEVASEWLSQPVIINPNNNWGENERVQAKNYHVLGLPKDGTLAEYIIVNADRLHKKPLFLSDTEAAALPLAGLTAYRALFTRAGLQKGEKVLISGIGGGVALFAMQFAIAAGAEVYVTSSSDAKIAQAKVLGAMGGANYRTENWQKGFLKTVGEMDVVIDSAGGNGFAQLVDTLSAGGRIAFYGGGQGLINNLSPQKVFWKQISIFGSTMGSDSEFAKMLDFVERHQLKPVIDSVFDLENGRAAFAKMESGAQFGKIVVRI
ncbi:MAG: hypothetical protein RI894_861, partial [Bacteroidota bacterium]